MTPTPLFALALALALTTLAPPAQARSEVCRSYKDADIAALFDRWNDSLKSGDPKRVVANYAERSVLLPTVSNRVRLTPQDKLDYFESFLQKKPQGTIDSRQIYGACNTAIDAGIYTFSFDDGSKVQARYTFTYHWTRKGWLITSHHSSVMPQP